MSSQHLQTTPLFPTSLRAWQMNWKANQGQANANSEGNRLPRIPRLRRPRRALAERSAS